MAIDWKIWRAAAHTTVAQKHLWHLSDVPSTPQPLVSWPSKAVPSPRSGKGTLCQLKMTKQNLVKQSCENYLSSYILFKWWAWRLKGFGEREVPKLCAIVQIEQGKNDVVDVHCRMSPCCPSCIFMEDIHRMRHLSQATKKQEMPLGGIRRGWLKFRIQFSGDWLPSMFWWFLSYL